MRSKIITIIIAATLLAGCKKDNTKTTATLEVTLQWQNGTAMSNTSVKLLSYQQKTSSNPVATGTSDASGKIDFTVSPGKFYYLYYDGANNESIANTKGATCIIIGTFASQQQIDSSPYQSYATKVGDPIYMDINGDGIIDAKDLALQVGAPTAGNTNSVTLTLFTNNVL